MDSKRTPAVHASRHAAPWAALALVVVLAACDDTTTVEPPPPAPHVATTQTYSKSSNGLPNTDVHAMLTLSNGEFWIGTEQGIARYPSIDATTRIAGPDGIVNELNGLPNPKVRDMAEYNSKVYVGTWGGGIAIYDIATSTWTSRTPADDRADDVQNVVVGRALSSGGVVVAAGANAILETVPLGDDRVSGTNIVDGGNRVAETTAHHGLDGDIADIQVSPLEGKIYLGTNEAISVYDPALDRFASFTALTRQVVSAVSVRDTPAGIERWYGPRVESIEDESQGRLPDAGITVWRGTSTVFNYTMVNSGLPEPNVTSIFFDPDSGPDIFWVATGSNGVSRVAVDASTWTTYTTVQGLPSNTVYSVTRAAAPGGGSTIWAATQDGIARLEGNGKWQSYNTSGGLAADRVRLVYSDDGQHLWIGYITSGAARLNPAGAQ